MQREGEQQDRHPHAHVEKKKKGGGEQKRLEEGEKQLVDSQRDKDALAARGEG